MPQGQLAQVLGGVIDQTDERLLVGPGSVDDAGIVALDTVVEGGTGLALVQTVDYFPPVVDDPYFYGAIAAANALSDVYAMGGRPLSALNLAGFPSEFPDEWLAEIFRGGFDKMREAGAVVAGGHTVRSKEAQFGFAVTGVVEREACITNAGAREGDRLYLTKPIGMGTMTTAAKAGRVEPEQLEPASRLMATLNADAAEAMCAAGASACTDVTGFGLAGHAHNVAAASGVTLRIDLRSVPIFPGAFDLARAGSLSGGSKRGRASLGEGVGIDLGLDESLVGLAFDAETSGGLLIAIAPERAAALEGELARRSVQAHSVGGCTGPSERRVELV
ncbi:MAG: selenide, water dikinase SelD [Planctomycetes bacterium]|jgi:selenide,water dikinase|nr:selenide, water dikinase SelD [Planctomycetota bacterium]MDP6409241.1 selenide, water dikinase SelD [Planctomycetota bacterium]